MATVRATPKPRRASARTGIWQICAGARWLALPALMLLAWELASALGWLRQNQASATRREPSFLFTARSRTWLVSVRVNPGGSRGELSPVSRPSVV